MVDVSGAAKGDLANRWWCWLSSTKQFRGKDSPKEKEETKLFTDRKSMWKINKKNLSYKPMLKTKHCFAVPIGTNFGFENFNLTTKKAL